MNTCGCKTLVKFEISHQISYNLESDFRNRRDRESSILKAIENGGTTLFDLVSAIYKEVDRGLWFVAASNVRLHVEHLAEMHKLPEVIFTVRLIVFDGNPIFICS